MVSRVKRSTFASALLGVIVLGVTNLVALPLHAQECHPEALRSLQRLSPHGYRVYRDIADKQDFLHWVTCDDIQLGLATAVHETVHMLTEQWNAYPLIGGGRLPRVHEHASLFRPRDLAHRFNGESTFVATYLKPGAATSAEEFGFLLDEMNAYSHDLDTAVRLAPIESKTRDVYHRDGLAALMAFVAGYVEEARAKRPETWRELSKPPVRHVVATLWSQAERVMGASCRARNYGDEAAGFLTSVCAAHIDHGLGRLLGRPPLCAIRCTMQEASLAGPPSRRVRLSRGFIAPAAAPLLTGWDAIVTFHR